MLADTPDTERYDVEAVNAAKTRQPLYAPRKKIFPKRANGRFRRFKWLVMLITLTIYYVTPWIRWDRGPYAPNQAVLIDLANMRFYFFSIEIWPQEFYYVAGMLVMAGIGLFLITSTVGRAWCGYACPQTVWVDLFLVVERAIEGDRNARIKLDAAPWTFDKMWKRVTKHASWILIGIATGGAWIVLGLLVLLPCVLALALYLDPRWARAVWPLVALCVLSGAVLERSGAAGR